MTLATVRVEAVQADLVRRAEGLVWRYTIYTDAPKSYRELPEIQAREVLENHGISREGIDHIITTARVKCESWHDTCELP